MFCYGLLLSSRLQEVMSSLLIKKREDEAIKGLLRVDYSKPNLFKRRNSKKAALTCKGSLTEYWLSICTQTCTEYLTNGSSSRPHQISTTPRLATPPPSQESSSALVHRVSSTKLGAHGLQPCQPVLLPAVCFSQVTFAHVK